MKYIRIPKKIAQEIWQETKSYQSFYTTFEQFWARCKMINELSNAEYLELIKICPPKHSNCRSEIVY